MADGDDGGSFWSTFGGGAEGGAAEVSPLERLLQDSSCSIEALLDEEEVFQEFKACNERLVARLSEPAVAKVLLEFITCEPPEEATSKRCFRYPFVAVELMTCGPDQFFRALVKPENSEIMDTLWDFMEATPAAEVNPVLAGYFSRTAASIFSKHPTEVVEYLRKRGTDTLLERFLERLHLRSLAELFARLLCADEPAHAVFSVDGLVTRLLHRLEDGGPDSDTQENVTLVVLELLAQKDSLCFGDDILRQLSASSSVSFLVDHIFSGGLGGIAAATSILSNVVIHTYVALKGISVCASTPTLSPLSPPPITSSLGEDDVVNVGADDSVVGEAAQARMAHSPPRSPSAAPRAECPAMWLEARSTQLMREICGHLPRLCALLDAALEQRTQLQMPHGAVRSVGGAALEAVSLLSMLAKTGSPLVLEAVLQQQLVPRCLELFFRHPWSSLLHNAVRSLLFEVLAAEAVPPVLVLGLLREGGLLARVVAEYREESLAGAPGARGRVARVGYMGHLHAMCAELRDYGERTPEVGAALQAAEGWSDVVLPALEANQKVQSEKLGGDISAEDRGLASSSITGLVSPTASTDNDNDFVLDSLEGVDELSLSAAVPEGSPGTGSTAPGLPRADDLFDPEAFPAEAPPSAGAATAPRPVVGWSSAEEPWVAEFDDAPGPGSPPATCEPAPDAFESTAVAAAAGQSSGPSQTPLSWPMSFETPAVHNPGITPANSSTLASMDMPPAGAVHPAHSSAPWTASATPHQGAGPAAMGAGEPRAGVEAPAVGSENLFALLGEGDQLGAFGGLARAADVPPATPPAPAPPAAGPPSAPPGAALGSPAPLAAPAPAPVAAPGSPAMALRPADLAAFDPLFQPSADPPAGAARAQAGAPPWGGQRAGAGGEVGDLAALAWPQGSGPAV